MADCYRRLAKDTLGCRESCTGLHADIQYQAHGKTNMELEEIVASLQDNVVLLNEKGN